MAGYPISELKKASQAKGRDQIPLQQDGVTRQVELGIMDNAVKVTASTSSGLIYKEGSYVLQNNSAVINFTLDNAVGRELSGNSYVDSASAAAGWIVKVINLSTRSHTVIYGSNSWSIAAGEIQEYYWTGSAWTFYNPLTDYSKNYKNVDNMNNAKCDIGKVAFFYVASGSQNTPPLPSGVSAGWNVVVYNASSNAYRLVQVAYSTNSNYPYTFTRTTNDGVTWSSWQKLVTETDLNGALADYEKVFKYNVTFGVALNTSEKYEGFKTFILSKINEWNDGDIVKITNGTEKANFHVQKINNSYFNIFYMTYYISFPTNYRYINGTWQKVEATTQIS